MLYNGHRVTKEYAVLVPSPFEVIHLHQLGFGYTVGLLGLSVTDDQIALLSRFKRLLVLHPDPNAVITRLAGASFVKAPALPKEIMLMSREEVQSLI